MTGTSIGFTKRSRYFCFLLQQHYKNVTNNFMRAATLKGLACHTADDAGESVQVPYW